MSFSIEQETDIERLRQVAHLQEAENGRLHQRLATLAGELDKFKGTDMETLQQELTIIKEQLDRRMRELYGPKSEKRPQDKDAETSRDSNTSSDEQNKDKTPKTGHGPTNQAELEIVEKIIELSANELIDEKTGEKFYEMKGQFEESEVIEVVHRSYKIVKYKRKKYRSSANDRIITAPAPLKVIPGGRYSPEFAVHVAISKYADHLPLARQASIMARFGLQVTRQTLWDQIDALADILEPGYTRLFEQVLLNPIVGADETRWPLLEKKRLEASANGGKKKSKLWWAWSVSGVNGIVYRIIDNRATRAADKVLGKYDGIVIADGYAAYGSLQKTRLKDKPDDHVFKLAFCWAHVRRKFINCELADPRATEALKYIRDLYRMERRIATDSKGLSNADYLAKLAEARNTESRNTIREFGEWIAKQKALPKSGFGKALTYTSNLWQGLKLFLDDPLIPLDNNRTERGMRALAVGRKNHYGSKSRRGTKVAALFYSLIETAKLLGVDPEKYLLEACMQALKYPGKETLPEDLSAKTK